ncbi:inositol monophosphatase family protein [Dactylosporangium sp. CA-092794]|uniref:inositol monophosphatase family protein n=1 Tax=Dactylosporangium sp. CA-092794 TaxID=3239929 RepID=UPI003D945E11
MQPESDASLAGRLAGEAGALLMGLRGTLGTDPEALRAAGDKGSHDLITTALARRRPGDAVLSEEGARDDPARLAADRVWIVDPLDGTREFGEPGRTDWAVHIALWERTAAAPSRLAAAAVALPARRRVWTTDDPPVPAGDAGRPLLLAVSRSRAPEFLTGVAMRLGAELVPMGSAGAKICAVATGDVDAYVHAGGQYEWDSAAPVALARAAGLYAARLDGSPLEYNRPDPWLPDLVVCRPELVDPLLSALGEVQ